jgi:5'-deoxynucleotidase YfbR-like HD superfamily hydrolase
MKGYFFEEDKMLGGYTRDLAHVPRWGICRTAHRQSVAEHSYYVTLYTVAICRMLELDPEQMVVAVQVALTHDMDETMSGDIPAPWKVNTGISGENDYLKRVINERFGPTASASDFILQIVRVADLFEAAMFCCGEMAVGNATIRKVAESQVSNLLVAANALIEMCEGDARAVNSAKYARDKMAAAIEREYSRATEPF